MDYHTQKVQNFNNSQPMSEAQLLENEAHIT